MSAPKKQVKFRVGQVVGLTCDRETFFKIHENGRWPEDGSFYYHDEEHNIYEQAELRPLTHREVGCRERGNK